MKNIEILRKMTLIQYQIDKKSYETDMQLKAMQYEFNLMVHKLRVKDSKYLFSTPEQIIQEMKDVFNAPKNFEKPDARNRISTSYKYRTIAICKEIFYPRYSLKSIASYFNRTHTQIGEAMRTVKNMCDTDKKYRAEFEEMQKYFLGSVEI